MVVRKLASLGLLAGTLVLGGSAEAQDVQAGTLTCDVSGGIGLIVGSQKEMVCTFKNSRGELEVYTGTVRKFGLDIGATTGGRIDWAVFAPSAVARGALAGNYAGASAQATVGVGLGANVLVGGSDRSFALQPLSFQGQTGLNVAAGVSSLELRAGRPIR